MKQEVKAGYFKNVAAASEEECQTRIDLAAMFRLTQMMGWDDTVWNHITARVPGTDHQFSCIGLVCYTKKSPLQT
ncbi:MAG: hypothetical protein ACI88H_000760 [Cocleimonas sp.]|jgi:hypothetical protein